MSNLKSNSTSLFAKFFLPVILGSALLVYVAWTSDVVAVAITTLVLAVVYYLKYLIEKRAAEFRAIEENERDHAAAMSRHYLKTIESLAIAIDAKDQTSHGHLRRTQVYATELGRLLAVSQGEHESLVAGALLHDIGKLAVPEYILNKPEQLTTAESAKIRIHPTVGADILSRVGFPYPVEDAVRYHHERWDGTGYPSGLKAESIPLVARIISVADFYDASRCDRPYRAGLKREDSLSLLKSLSGSAFDPRVVAKFVEYVEGIDRLISRQDLLEQVASDEIAENESVLNCESDLPSKSRNPNHNLGFRSISEAKQEFFALNEITQTIGSSLSLQDTATLVSNKLSAIVPHDICVIYLVDEKSGQVFPAHVSGDRSTAFSERRINIGDGITGWVIASGQTISSSSPELDLLRIPEEISREIKHVLVAPLKREEGAFGAITLYSSSNEPYSTENVRLVEVVARHVSNAINNALTFEKTRATALIDPVTELPNSRAFYMALEQRIAECQRLKNREPITILSMNLDKFRQINDALGHATGDAVLKVVAAVIKKQLRQMDILTRLSGDEFVAVLPMASNKTSFLIAERIQDAISQHDFPEKNEHGIEMGVSVGIATYPDDGDSTEQLLTSAHRNMQHDKHARRLAPSVFDSSIARIQTFRVP